MRIQNPIPNRRISPAEKFSHSLCPKPKSFYSYIHTRKIPGYFADLADFGTKPASDSAQSPENVMVSRKLERKREG